MGRITGRLIAGPLLALAAGVGLAVAPGAANAAGISAVVDVNTATLKIRSGPTLAGKVLGQLHDNQRITASCAVTGQSVRGKVRTTTQWDRLTAGGWVTDAYVRSVKGIPRCSSPQASPVQTKPVADSTPTAKYVTGTVSSTDGAVNVRTAPATTATSVRTVLDGQTVSQVCAVAGSTVSGTVRTTAQWNRLSDGVYISDAYVVTGALPVCAGSSAPAATPSMTTAQFIAAAVPGAQAGWREYGVPASVTMAQAILESGWGRSSLSVTDKNFFGIKCQSGAYGTLATGCHTYNTTECDKAGNCFPTAAVFRTYATMANSFRDHGSFLRVNSRYAPAFVYTKQPDAFIWTVWKAGYATDPTYYTKITTLMSAYDLYQYDIWK